jgi:hypothetical protein
MLISAQVRVEDDIFQASGATGNLIKRRDEMAADFG